MATVNATCPGCHATFPVPAAFAGKKVKCKSCGGAVPVPVPPVVAKPVAAKPVIAKPVAAKPAAPPKAMPVPTVAPKIDDAPLAMKPDEWTVTVEPPVAGDDFAFASPATKRHRTGGGGGGGGSGKLVGAVAGLTVLAALAGVGGFLYVNRPDGTNDADKVSMPKRIAPGPKPAIDPDAIHYPRRFLFVSVSQYAFLNPLTPGTSATGDVATATAKKLAFAWRVPTDGDANQFYALSDSATPDAPPVTRAVLRPTVDRFLDASRPQDRVVVYFGGHAIEKDGKAYFCPSDGDPDDAETLIPVAALYEKFKSSPAQQKVVIWDVCRYNPEFGRVLPGSEPMPEGLAKALAAVPPGVQAWVTCSAGENAVELTRSGSEFLAAVRTLVDRGQGPKAGDLPDDAIPAAEWVAAVQAKLDNYVRKDDRPGQTTAFAGTPGLPVPFDPVAAPATRVELPKPPAGANPAAVAAAFKLIDLPPLRSDKALATAFTGKGFPVPADALKEYLADGMTLEAAAKEKEKYPIRAAAANAILTMRKVWRGAGKEGGGLRETFVGEANDRVKKSILAEQEVPARIILELDSVIDACEKLEPELDKEPSKRWRATFQYALAQARARWVYMNEYNLMLGVINKNELPPLEPGKNQTGWRMVPTETMKSKKDVKDRAEAAQELFAKVATEHKGTPWAALAKQAKNLKLGLDWKVVSPADEKDKLE